MFLPYLVHLLLLGNSAVHVLFFCFVVAFQNFLWCGGILLHSPVLPSYMPLYVGCVIGSSVCMHPFNDPIYYVPQIKAHHLLPTPNPPTHPNPGTPLLFVLTLFV